MRRKVIAAVAAAASAAVLTTAGLLGHSYFYDATFMQVPPGYSTVTQGSCTTGQPLYFGYNFEPTRDVQITGVELQAAPDAFTVEGVYAVNQAQNGKPMLGAGTQQDWDQNGYSKDHLYPVAGVELHTGGADWWFVAKIIPLKRGQQEIPTITVSYRSGDRSGSTVYPEQVITTCPK